jgi:hypothetical protein
VLGDDVARPYVMCAAPVPAEDRFPALVDSGADGSSLPLALARRLHVAFDPARTQVAYGAGGSFVHHEAEGDVVLASEIGPITLTKPSISAALPFILLGRRDFFEGRRVCFDQRGQRLEVEAL